MIEIKILCPEGPKCDQTAAAVREAISETGVEATIDNVTDVLKIAGSGVYGTPAVMINGEVKSVGNVPTKEEVVSWIVK